MGFSILNCEQRSAAWFAARAGKVTSTGANDMLATIQKGEAAARRNLRLKLALERVTGKTLESDFLTDAMRQGIEREAEALAQYEAITGNHVQRCGFLQDDELACGASLDGYVGDFEGVVEAKCPEWNAHLEYLQTNTPPTKYLRQITHQLYVTGAAWADFLSWQPDFPEALRTRIVRVQRTDVDLAAYELALRLFIKEVDQQEQAILALAPVEATGVR